MVRLPQGIRGRLPPQRFLIQVSVTAIQDPLGAPRPSSRVVFSAPAVFNVTLCTSLPDSAVPAHVGISPTRHTLAWIARARDRAGSAQTSSSCARVASGR